MSSSVQTDLKNHYACDQCKVIYKTFFQLSDHQRKLKHKGILSFTLLDWEITRALARERFFLFSLTLCLSYIDLSIIIHDLCEKEECNIFYCIYDGKLFNLLPCIVLPMIIEEEANNNSPNVERTKDNVRYRRMTTTIGVNRWLAHIWQCEKCPYVFKSYKDLLMHKWDYHSH